MKITLVSDDRSLYELCRDALANTQTSSWTLSMIANRTDVLVSDYCIWDVDSGTPLTACRNLNPATCLFIVDRLQLDAFRATDTGAASNILLKPIPRDALAAYLDFVFATTITENTATTRDSAAQSLLRTNLRLQKYDQERSAFLASIAHDMRTPVTALLGYSSLLLNHDGEFAEEGRKSILRHMQNSANRLSRMVSAIFEMSVELQSARSADLRPGDLPSCIDQAWHEVALIAADRHITLDASVELSGTDLYFDSALIERVVINIFENACRFAPLKGRIQVRGYPFFWERRNPNAPIPAPERRFQAAPVPNSVRLDIWNSGPPIPPELVEYIFEQYVTVDEPSRAHWGCGLGLAICRTIVNQHRGRIWAQNTESGPTFCVVLPTGYPKSLSTGGVGEYRQANDAIGLANNNAYI
jgi:signal transduction histidine kinase